jgi:hypothetical protein
MAVKIFTYIVIIMYFITSYLIYKAGGDMNIWITIGTPVVILRFIRALLLMK